MEKIKQISDEMYSLVKDIKSGIELAEAKKLTYGIAKNIRKSAQTIKIKAKDLRFATTATLKELKKTDKQV